LGFFQPMSCSSKNWYM
jgi:hypothetical protein